MSTSTRTVSGRYRGRMDGFEVELRVDVDGARPTRRVSADYRRVSDGTPLGSMRLDRPSVSVTPSLVTVTGTADFTWSTTSREIAVSIPRAGEAAGPAPATLSHAWPDGHPGITYRCAFESPWFRTVELEEACEAGVHKFESYDTGLLPSGGAGRHLSHIAAFAEAGIELHVAKPPTIVGLAGAGTDAAWSDAELNAAMEESFTRWADRPQWAVWMMHAFSHDSDAFAGPDDPRLQGLMFDRKGAERQGCAIFYGAMRGGAPDTLRRQLHTCVHELAHGFNLVHCWEKSLARPPIPSRPAAPSWMNYPDRFPGGTDRFWEHFGFEFDDLELVHLRHGFRDDVIMGGSPFLSNAALEQTPDWGSGHPHHADPGLRLGLSVAPRLAYGVPLTVDFELAVRGGEDRHVPTVLGPRSGTVDVAIRHPSGEASVFEPYIRHCRGGQTMRLAPGDPPVRDSAFLHYGRQGYPFRDPGRYELQARYTAADGSYVRSPVVRTRIEGPRSAAERELGALTYGVEQAGALMSVMGSDASALARGNHALRAIIARFPEHPTADIARLVRGANAARSFKSIRPSGRVQVREPQLVRARALVDPVVDIDSLHRAAAGAAAVTEPRAIARELSAIGTRPGVSPAVDAFIRSRRQEIAAEVPRLAHRHRRTSSDPPRRPPPSLLPPPQPQSY